MKYVLVIIALFSYTCSVVQLSNTWSIIKWSIIKHVSTAATQRVSTVLTSGFHQSIAKNVQSVGSQLSDTHTNYWMLYFFLASIISRDGR